MGFYFIMKYVLKEIVAKRFYNAEALGTMDEFFMYDSDKNRSNILTVMHFDKFKGSPIDFGNFILDAVRAKKSSKKEESFPRMQHKLKKFFGEFYFVKMDYTEYSTKRKDMLEILSDKDFNTQEDICNFISTEQVKREPLENC